MEKELIYSTDSHEHFINLNEGKDLLLGDYEEEIVKYDPISLIPYDKLCQCGQDEIYSETLTNGLCLNCYHQQQEEYRWMELEYEDEML